MSEAGRRAQRIKMGLAAALLVAALAGLIAFGLSGADTYYLTLEELEAQGQATLGRHLRVQGEIKGETVQWDPIGLVLRFEITDGVRRLPILYRGVKPDNVDSGNVAIVEGRYTPQGVLEADKLMIKCPSTYEEEERGASKGGRTG